MQGQPERSHLSWQAGLHAKAKASAESESQADAAASAAPDLSSGATRPGAACFPGVRGATAGANRARPGRTSGGGGRAGAARGSRRRPGHRMAGDRKPAGREPASRPPAVPAPPPRRRQSGRWARLTRDRPGSRRKASAGTRKHVLSGPRALRIGAYTRSDQPKRQRIHIRQHLLSEVVITIFTSSRARGARRAGGGRCSWKAPRDRTADRALAERPPVTGWRDRGPRRAWAPATSFGPSGHVGAVAYSVPGRRRTGSSPQRQRWRAELQERPSLRRPILKPRKIAVKGAPPARCLRAQAQTLNRESCRGFNRRLSKRWPRPSAVATTRKHHAMGQLAGLHRAYLSYAHRYSQVSCYAAPPRFSGLQVKIVLLIVK